MRRSRDFVETKASFNAITPPYGVKARMVVLPLVKAAVCFDFLPAEYAGFFYARRRFYGYRTARKIRAFARLL